MAVTSRDVDGLLRDIWMEHLQMTVNRSSMLSSFYGISAAESNGSSSGTYLGINRSTTLSPMWNSPWPNWYGEEDYPEGQDPLWDQGL